MNGDKLICGLDLEYNLLTDVNKKALFKVTKNENWYHMILATDKNYEVLMALELLKAYMIRNNIEIPTRINPKTIDNKYGLFTGKSLETIYSKLYMFTHAMCDDDSIDDNEDDLFCRYLNKLEDLKNEEY